MLILDRWNFRAIGCVTKLVCLRVGAAVCEVAVVVPIIVLVSIPMFSFDYKEFRFLCGGRIMKYSLEDGIIIFRLFLSNGC